LYRGGTWTIGPSALDTGDNVGTTTDKTELLRKLPSVDAILRSPALEAVVARDGQIAVTDAARTVLARIREEVLAARLDDKGVSLAVSGLAEAVERQMRANVAYSLRAVINATGVILHTNLGRAPLSAAALEHIREVAGAYSNLEFDIEAGERGKRDVHVDRLFAQLLGDAGRDLSTLVVNNNAAAVLIALNTLADAGEVIVSRGELVEIGGSFRVPDVMAKSGATLREVGTTNRTRAADYENAITEKTRLLMRVHRSNFEMLGFTEQPSLEELVEVGRKHRIPVLEDVGSGAFFDLRNINVHGEPTILDSIRAGVDVVTYSGDKLLGGPQAGIISGTRELVAKIRKNPLFRALRVDKLTYAALEATMLAYMKQDHDAIPAIRMMRISEEELQRRAEAIHVRVAGAPLAIEIVQSESVIGGGAAPTATLPTRALALTSPEMSADDIAERLRHSEPPIIARVEDNRVLLDLRTVFPEQDEQVAHALLALKL
jgi:L-seryl-tRNA(Ser) seleniumtransferase